MDTESKNELWRELSLKTDLYVDGVNITPAALKSWGKDGKYLEQIHYIFEMDLKIHPDVTLPFGFYLPNGLCVPFKWNPDSAYTVGANNGDFILSKQGKKVSDVKFISRPEYYSKKTSDNQFMSTVLGFAPDDSVAVCYSNECSLKDKGEDCLYCNINPTKETYGEKEGIFWKNPKQIGEAVAAAYDEKVARRFNITGGFIPERREVDYYLDVADEIKSQTGQNNFHGNATIGAPLDHSVVERYREAGFNTIAMNIEIWDKNFWKTICPGKDSVCGGWENWVGALKHSVKVFGRGKVRSLIVAGIEPKEKTLEGIDYLASNGIICCASPWCPNPGSALEGHRTPEPAWHLDMAKKIAAIYGKYGFGYEEFHELLPASASLVHDIFKIENGLPYNTELLVEAS